MHEPLLPIAVWPHSYMGPAMVTESVERMQNEGRPDNRCLLASTT
jgi:hypothetical protein